MAPPVVTTSRSSTGSVLGVFSKSISNLTTLITALEKSVASLYAKTKGMSGSGITSTATFGSKSSVMPGMPGPLPIPGAAIGFKPSFGGVLPLPPGGGSRGPHAGSVVAAFAVAGGALAALTSSVPSTQQALEYRLAQSQTAFMSFGTGGTLNQRRRQVANMWTSAQNRGTTLSSTDAMQATMQGASMGIMPGLGNYNSVMAGAVKISNLVPGFGVQGGMAVTGSLNSGRTTNLLLSGGINTRNKQGMPRDPYKVAEEYYQSTLKTYIANGGDPRNKKQMSKDISQSLLPDNSLDRSLNNLFDQQTATFMKDYLIGRAQRDKPLTGGKGQAKALGMSNTDVDAQSSKFATNFKILRDDADELANGFRSMTGTVTKLDGFLNEIVKKIPGLRKLLGMTDTAVGAAAGAAKSIVPWLVGGKLLGGALGGGGAGSGLAGGLSAAASVALPIIATAVAAPFAFKGGEKVGKWIKKATGGGDPLELIKKASASGNPISMEDAKAITKMEGSTTIKGGFLLGPPKSGIAVRISSGVGGRGFSIGGGGQGLGSPSGSTGLGGSGNSLSDMAGPTTIAGLVGASHRSSVSGNFAPSSILNGAASITSGVQKVTSSVSGAVSVASSSVGSLFARNKDGSNVMATKALQDMKDMFGAGNDGIFSSSGHKAKWGKSDHDTGDAVDLHVSSIAQGNKIAEYLRTNYVKYGIKYLIFNKRIWNPSISMEWRPYTRKGGDPHTAHVHVSFSKGSIGAQDEADNKNGGGAASGGKGGSVSSNKALIINAFKGAGYSDAQVAGVLGNVQVESGFNNMVKPGDGGKAYGLFQMHSSYGTPAQRQDPGFSIAAILKEAKRVGFVPDNKMSVEEAAVTFDKKVERSSGAARSERVAAAKSLSGSVTQRATGAWNLPQDEFARLHAGEMVLPAKIAGAVREALSGMSSGGGDSKVYIALTVQDASDAEAIKFANKVQKIIESNAMKTRIKVS